MTSNLLSLQEGYTIISIRTEFTVLPLGPRRRGHPALLWFYKASRQAQSPLGPSSNSAPGGWWEVPAVPITPGNWVWICLWANELPQTGHWLPDAKVTGILSFQPQKNLRLEMILFTLNGMAHLAGRRPTKIAGSIPGQGTCLSCRFGPRARHIWEAINWCVSPSLPFPSL